MAMTGAMLMAADARWGDPPITGAGGEGGLRGGVDPPGGITDEPPEVATTDGAWTATVGGTEFAGLTEDDVGTVLWRGSMDNVLYEDYEGNDQSASVCASFPALSLSGTATGLQPIERKATLRLDPANCTVSLQSVLRGADETDPLVGYSPGVLLGARWYRDQCYEDLEYRDNSIYWYQEGHFHGESTGWVHRFTGDTHHTLTGILETFRNGDVYDCRLGPDEVEAVRLIVRPVPDNWWFPQFIPVNMTMDWDCEYRWLPVFTPPPS